MRARRSRGGRATPVRLRLRRARTADVELLVEHRRKMWLAIGGRLRAHLERADPVYRRWVRRELASRHFFGFIVEAPDGRPAGSGAIWLVPTQPRPGRLGRPRMPYILSMFTEPEFRGRGVATQIVTAQVRWAEDRGYGRIFLHASAMGRSVYTRLGFSAGNEMRLDLPARRRHRGSRGRARP
ncbi:MAG: GNAT family N-acetyltransferase [Thermoplasmata archaeon]